MSRDAVKSFFPIESRHRIRLSPPLIELLDRGHRVTPEQYARARAKRATTTAQWFDACSSATTPSSTIPAPGEAPEGLANTGDATLQLALDADRACRRSRFPRAAARAGLPLGLQIVGRYRDDERALQVAAWCEAMLGVQARARPVAEAGAGRASRSRHHQQVQHAVERARRERRIVRP